jgi:GTP cyclohydrolase I
MALSTNLTTPTLNDVLDARERAISGEQMRRFEAYAAEMLTAFGLDPESPATGDTPHRFVQALFDATAGYDGDPKLETVFATECHSGPNCTVSQIIEGPIRFNALCEHHALPFFGHAYVGYIADERIIGISKLARLVHLFGRRFAVQERIGQQIADALEAMVAPHGVAVYLEARHICMEKRGVREESSLTRTTVWRGEYQTNAAPRAEFLAALHR